nr:serine hydrolase [uncultured Blautia sp.]
MDRNKQTSGKRSGAVRLRRYGAVFVAAAVLASAGGVTCYGAEDTAGEESAEQDTASLEGEGTLSPSGGSSEESVFGSNSVPEEDSNVGSLTDEKLQQILKNVEAGFPAGNGSWAVYISDLKRNSEGSVNSHAMQAASLIKLYIMGAVYDNYDSVVAQYGQSSVESNLHSMITVSDNDAANTLVSYLGGGDSAAGMNAVNSFCQTHGYTDTSMGRLLLQSNANGDNYTSVSDCGRFLRSVYAGNFGISSETDMSENKEAEATGTAERAETAEAEATGTPETAEAAEAEATGTPETAKAAEAAEAEATGTPEATKTAETDAAETSETAKTTEASAESAAAEAESAGPSQKKADDSSVSAEKSETEKTEAEKKADAEGPEPAPTESTGSTASIQEYAHASDMFALLAGQQRRNKIPAQMPAGVSVANKTGELSNVENDAGIIYNTSNDVVIVFMSEGLGEVGSAQNSIASLSRQIYDYYNS